MSAQEPILHPDVMRILERIAACFNEVDEASEDVIVDLVKVSSTRTMFVFLYAGHRVRVLPDDLKNRASGDD